MAESNSQNWTITDRIARFGGFVKTAAVEIVQGVMKDRIPAHQYCYPGIFAALALLGHLDETLTRVYHWNLHLSHGVRNFLVYSFLASGWITWGVARAIQRNLLLTSLMNAFESAKLKCNGRYPSLIEDVEIDENLRRLRLKTNGVPKTDFDLAVERIEASLNFTVVRILQEDGDKSRLDILYTTEDLPIIAHLEKRDRFVDAQIPIGLTYEGTLGVNLRDVGHLLVAGQTGGGKSNYLKLVTSILSANNPDAAVQFLDFKGGMESADLKNQISNLNENITYFDGTRPCIQELARLGDLLELRLSELAERGASTFDEYLKAGLAVNNGVEASRTDKTMKRQFIVIDELAQLSAKEPGVEIALVKKAKAALNRISRQGRAAGVHLIVATQKPDSSNFDQTVKANLPGVLCFPMTTQAASVSAIGSKRAYELNPDRKGRAVWKFGPKCQEVQTYLFT